MSQDPPVPHLEPVVAKLRAEVEELRARDTDRAPPPERFPMLLTIGLGDALDAVERVVVWAQNGKHRGKKWESQTPEHQQGKLLRHLGSGMLGETVDEDTGEHPFAHVAARALMLLGLVLKTQRVR